MEALATTAYSTHQSTGRRRRTVSLGVGCAALAAVILVGSYSSHWSWTGISGRTATLWDWVNLLLLPVTVATLPIWLRKREMLDARRKALAGAIVATFAVLVVAGYSMPLKWTGFRGNTLWDWINLLLLPLVVATFPVWPDIRRELRMHHRVILGALAVGFAVAVVGGYAFGWGWTGFRGNTLWQWLHLLLLPIAIPTILLPAALAITAAGMGETAD